MTLKPLLRQQLSPTSLEPAGARTPVDVEAKGDASPVTIADREAEVAMRGLIGQAFPEHGIFGEEHGLKWGSGPGSKYMWVLDPIDGTKSFITGGVKPPHAFSAVPAVAICWLGRDSRVM